MKLQKCGEYKNIYIYNHQSVATFVFISKYTLSYTNTNDIKCNIENKSKSSARVKVNLVC